MVEVNGDLKIVIGLGKTGSSCVRYLTKQGVNNLVVVDSRINPPGLVELRQQFPQVPVYLGGFDEKILSQATELIVSPGVSLTEPAISACFQRGIKITGDIELFSQATQAPVVAITGSNGKSTVTSIVGMMVAAAGKRVGVGGNLGVPALDLLDKDIDFYVLELSSFQLETTKLLQAAAAVVLNISPDHLDRYGSLDKYLAAKQRIYSGCHTAVINRDDPLSYADVKLPERIISFGWDKPQAGNLGISAGYLMDGAEKLLPIDKLKIKGKHNAANALAALALGKAIDLPLPTMLQTLCDFPGLAHRCQWVANVDDVSWYNDSKGTNVGATKAAIEGLGNVSKRNIILIAGGMGKDADFFPLRGTVATYVKAVVLIGKDAKIIEQALFGTCDILHAGSMSAAVAISMRVAASGDMVLFSPACASFDMFANFEQRGEVFMQEVYSLHLKMQK